MASVNLSSSIDTLTWHSTQEESPDVLLDKLMGKDDEITVDEFHERALQAELPKSRATNLLHGSKNYERTSGYRGHKATVKRKMRQ